MTIDESFLGIESYLASIGVEVSLYTYHQGAEIIVHIYNPSMQRVVKDIFIKAAIIRIINVRDRSSLTQLAAKRSCNLLIILEDGEDD